MAKTNNTFWVDKAILVQSFNSTNYLTKTVASTGSVAFAITSDNGTPLFSFNKSVTPTANDGAALGSTSLQWSDLFLASGGVVNFENGDATITHSSGLLSFNRPINIGGNIVLSGAFTRQIIFPNEAAEKIITYDSGGGGHRSYLETALGGTGGNKLRISLVAMEDDSVADGGYARLIARRMDATFDPATVKAQTGDGGRVTIGVGYYQDLVGPATAYIVERTFHKWGIDILNVPTYVLQLDSTGLLPATNNGTALGSTSLQWSDLFLASGGVINFANGNAAITHSTGLLTFSTPIAGTSATFLKTTEQLRLSYDANNYFNVTVDAAGEPLFRSSNGAFFFYERAANISTVLTLHASGSGGTYLDLTTAGGTWEYGVAPGGDYSFSRSGVADVMYVKYTGAVTNTLWLSTGRVGVLVEPLATLHVQSTTEQLRLSYDAGNYCPFTVGSTGTLGIYGGASANSLVNITKTLTTSGWYGFNVDLSSSGITSGNDIVALRASATATNGSTGGVSGIMGRACWNSTTAPDTWLLGVESIIALTANVTVPYTAGVYIFQPTKTTGTITSAYGLYIPAFTVATYNYAIYTNAGLVYHGDKVTVECLTEQLRLRYNSSNYAAFTVSATGMLTINSNGGLTTITDQVWIDNYLEIGSAIVANGKIVMHYLDGAQDRLGTLNLAALGADRTWSLPNAAGTLALQEWVTANFVHL